MTSVEQLTFTPAVSNSSSYDSFIAKLKQVLKTLSLISDSVPFLRNLET